MRHVRITSNFDRNLEEISAFLNDKDVPYAFDSLLEKLFDTIIPNLERFSDIGRDFLMHNPQSSDGVVKVGALKQEMGDSIAIRELIVGDYLILYAVDGQEIFLLSIKHHRQLSFDFKSHWVG